MGEIPETNMACFELKNNDLVKRYKSNYHYIFSDTKKFDILKSINHKNIVKLHGYDMDKKTLFLEFVESCYTLYEFLTCSIGVECSQLRNIFFNLASAVDCLHENNLIHGDISIHNVLIKRNFELKLNDFDWIKVINFAYEKQVDIASFQRVFFQIVVYKNNLPSIKDLNISIDDESKTFESCLVFLKKINFLCVENDGDKGN